MKRFQHPHVMGLVGVCLDAGPAPYIIMPYMANGSLQSYLKKERKSLILGEDADEDTVSTHYNNQWAFYCKVVFIFIFGNVLVQL